jgi:xanthine dehydrogenase accessory factor
MVRLFGRGASTTAVTDLPDGGRALAAALWPTPRLVVVGDGLLADALVDVATLLGWTGSVVNGVDDSVAAVAGLFRGDAVLVLTHERTVDAPVLRAALAGGAGYVGALGSRRTQAARTRWLAEHDVPEDVTGRVRGPAGLDIGARTPHEIAVSIAAEVLAVRAGAAGTPLRDRPGPVHVDGLNAPPPRYDSSPPRRTPL